MTALRIGIVALSAVLGFASAALGVLNRDTDIPPSQSVGSAAVRASLLAAVRETLQPVSASVWLKTARNDSRTASG